MELTIYLSTALSALLRSENSHNSGAVQPNQNLGETLRNEGFAAYGLNYLLKFAIEEHLSVSKYENCSDDD